MKEGNNNNSNDNSKATKTKDKPIVQGLRSNIDQFLILMLVNAFVGAMVGLEQTVLPLIGKDEFGIESNAVIVSFIASFGAAKAILNLFAGSMSDRWSRKNVLILGWLFGLPVPIILLFAPNWNWIIFANLLLGVNQGLAWSMTVNMKIDLVGKEKRGLALGLNGFAGHASIAIVGFVTGYVASTFGLKPYPFYLGIVFAISGLLISLLLVKDTKNFAILETREGQKEIARESKSTKSIGLENITKKPNEVASTGHRKNITNQSLSEAFIITSWKNRSLLALCQAGLVTNMVFAVSWGLLTIYFASLSLSINDIGFLKALHPGVWGILQLVTGSFSDKVGRKILIYSGMIIQGIAIWIVLISNSMLGWIFGMSLLGVGSALVYPTLQAAISDIAYPKWRATSLGIFRFWRDLGYVMGALGIGFIADLSSINIAIQLVAWTAIVSGIFVYRVMSKKT